MRGHGTVHFARRGDGDLPCDEKGDGGAGEEHGLAAEVLEEMVMKGKRCEGLG